MAYADFNGKVVEQAWGIFDMTLAGTVYAGQLCTISGVAADSDVSPAECVALDDGKSGQTIRAALAAVIRATSSQATGGGVTAATHGGHAGDILYLSSTAGAASETATQTIAQKVGWAIDTEKVMLMPMGTLHGWGGKYTSTLQNTGKTTFCRLLTCSSKATFTKLVTTSSGMTATLALTCSSKATFTKTLSCSSLITVAKALTCSSEIWARRPTHDGSSSKTLTSTQSNMVFTNDTDAKVYTLPATAPGLVYTFVNIGASTNCQIEIDTNASDKIIYNDLIPLGDGDKIVNTKATMNKGDSITLCGDPTGDGWLVTAVTGAWGSSS